jgi:uncharacterized repeat protein (TIGR03803 family)
MAERKMHAREQVRSLILGMTKGAAATAVQSQPAGVARHQNSLTTAAAMAIAFALAVVLLPAAQAQTYTVLHNFTGGQDGGTPFAGLTMDKAGNLYGTTYYGGSATDGVVFKLTRKGGSFIFNTLHSFGNGEGNGPYAKVTIGPDGSLYGTTQLGVPGPGCEGLGCGTVFHLRLPPTACKSALCGWSSSLVYQFPAGGNSGAFPVSAPVFDQNGNIFGATPGDGSYGNVYELKPSNGGWTQSVLYSFTGGSDGNYPTGDVIWDQAGNLYGVTYMGGTYGEGVVYQMVPSGSGWTENVLHSFNGASDGANPDGGLIFDKSGNLYGTTTGDDGVGVGTVFMLSPAGGTWTSTVLYSFSKWEEPRASLAMDAAGNLYGTADRGGKDRGGTIFKLTPGNGGWTYSLLKEFDDPCDEGCFPRGGVIIDASGNLYGTTSGGGAHGQGVVYEITP